MKKEKEEKNVRKRQCERGEKEVKMCQSGRKM